MTKGLYVVEHSWYIQKTKYLNYENVIKDTSTATETLSLTSLWCVLLPAFSRSNLVIKERFNIIIIIICFVLHYYIKKV